MYKLTVSDKFSAAHQLLNYNGKCENIHGHTFKISITVEGKNLDKSDLLVDFKVLKEYLKEIYDLFDHKLLNEELDFSPTSENLAKYIYDFIKPKLPKGIFLSEAVVWESDTACATYYE